MYIQVGSTDMDRDNYCDEQSAGFVISLRTVYKYNDR